MHARWFSSFQKGILALGAGAVFASCGGNDVTGSDPDPAIAAVGGGSPLANRLNAELLGILPKQAGKNWVFDGYSDPVTKEVAWSRSWTKKVDFTGVAWDKPRTLTLITPRHVVMAKHYVRKAGEVVKFHDQRGREVQRILMGLVKLPGPWDVAVGVLNEAVPSGVAHYKLLEPADDLGTNLVGTLALVTNRPREVLVHECKTIFPEMLGFCYPRSLPDGFSKPLVKGDSGNPSFLLVRGEPVLLETHTSGGPGAGPFYGSANIQAAIAAAISQLALQFDGGEYSIGTIRP